jgi:DNA helicase-2/ATP-dependent DNA helicase PcrA
VDECQDLSPIQHIMLERLKARGSRIIAVGDRHQAIYGFRGAKHDSMDDLKELFKMTELPLDISYRCAQSVVREASDPRLFDNCLVVCRNNAPMFAAILRHVRAKSPCIVLSNFLDSFQGFIRSFKTVYTTDLMVKVDRWYEKESAAAKAKGFKGKLAALSDKYETVKLLCAEFKRTEDVLGMVKRLGYGVSGPTFATIHKAKGLEHENVYILRPDLMPAIYAQSPEQKRQEANLEYVAITRAKTNLTYGVPLNVR